MSVTGGEGATMRYRKKPIEVDAFKLMYDSFPPWFQEEVERGRVKLCVHGADIETLEGTMHANPGDWVVKGIRGELYPVQPDIFEASYEPI